MDAGGWGRRRQAGPGSQRLGAEAWAVARRGLLGWRGYWAEQLGRVAGGPSGEEGEESERDAREKGHVGRK